MNRRHSISVPSINDGRTIRYETIWQRLPWTGPLAVLTWVPAIWTLSFFITKTPAIPERLLPIEARFIELPEPPAPPPVAHPDPPPVKRPLEHAAPATTPEPVAAQPTDQTTPDSPQPAELPAQNATQSTTAPIPNSASQVTRHPGATVRTESVGIVEPARGLTIMNEENPFDDDGTGNGWSPGGWVQESDACVAIPGKEGPCPGPVFAQPARPWCYNADPFHNWEIGTCKKDLDQATAAYKHEDYAAAFAQFKKLAEKDYAPAQSNLASMYAEGVGVSKDEQQAVYWWRKAAKDGDVKAIYNLALMYSDGKGVTKDDQQAAYWYQKAAYYGYEFAQYNLGVMYALGSGVPRDDQQAAYWYQKAANKGNPIAQYNLGAMYAEGTGVSRNDKQAVYWYCKAANRGHVQAKSGLAQLYSAGADQPKDAELAYFCWLFSSAKRTHQVAFKDRAMFERILSPQQRANAMTAAQIWKSR